MQVDPEFLKFLGKIQALPEAKKKAFRDAVYKEVGITPAESAPAKTINKG
jgi:hypothetical protein